MSKNFSVDNIVNDITTTMPPAKVRYDIDELVERKYKKASFDEETESATPIIHYKKIGFFLPQQELVEMQWMDNQINQWAKNNNTTIPQDQRVDIYKNLEKMYINAFYYRCFYRNE